MKNKNKILILFDQSIISAAHFAIQIFIARTLGLERFGLFSFFWMAFMFIQAIQLDFNINPFLSFFPKVKKYSKEYLANAFFQQLLFSTISVLVFVLIGIYFLFSKNNQNLASFSFLSGGTIFFWTLQDWGRRVLYSLDKIPMAIFSSFIHQALRGMGIFLIFNLNLDSPLKFLFLVLFLASLISLFPFFKIFIIFFKTKKRHPKLFYGVHWSFSKWFLSASVFQWIARNFLTVFAGWMLGVQALGGLRIAQNLLGPLHVLFSAFNNFIPSQLSKIYKTTGLATMKRYFYNELWTWFIFIIFLVSPLLFFPKDILRIAYGSEFEKYHFLLIGFTVIYIFIYFTVQATFLLRTLNILNSYFKVSLIAALITLTLSYPLIYFFDTTGVLIVMGVTYIYTFLGIWTEFKNKCKNLSR